MEHLRKAMGWNDKQLEIFKQMGAIVEATNAMEVKDLVQLDREINRDEATGPLIDPTAWRDGKFEEACMVKKVVRAIIAFKKEVSGVGRFHKVETHAKTD